jgi:glycosyltransferase involved in cell wall biosynthesis
MQAMNNPDGAPTVSVVLSVKNGGRDLPRALGTILNQSFTDFELIAINNGSTDATRSYLDSIGDPRVRVFHQEDAGLAGAFHHGISLARGRYIARQDHDDLADPSRIGKQVAFLDAHPDHALVGTRAEIWVGDTPTGRFHDPPTQDTDLRFALLFNNYFVHSSVMVRKTALDEVGVRSALVQALEDYPTMQVAVELHSTTVPLDAWRRNVYYQCGEGGIIERLIAMTGLSQRYFVFVETGTVLADTQASLSGDFDILQPIELRQDYHARAVARLAGEPPVRLINADSTSGIETGLVALEWTIAMAIEPELSALLDIPEYLAGPAEYGLGGHDYDWRALERGEPELAQANVDTAASGVIPDESVLAWFGTSKAVDKRMVR